MDDSKTKVLQEALAIKDEQARQQKVNEILGNQPQGCQRHYYGETRTSNDCPSGVEYRNCVDISNCPDSSDNRTVCSSWHC